MVKTIMPEFIRHEQEGAIIGRLLAGYGEIEIDLGNAVSEARNDRDMVFKSMFRPRGEKQRIDIADAIGRKPFRELELERQFSEAVGAARYCLKIRNQYAHCHWGPDKSNGSLGFVQMEEAAYKNNPMKELSLSIKGAPLDLLKKQEEYFYLTENAFWFLNHQAQVLGGRLSSHPFSFQSVGDRPPLYTP